MTRHTPPTRTTIRRWAAITAGASMLLVGWPAPAQQRDVPWYGAVNRPSFDAYRAPTGRFELEMPRKDWQVLPGGGSALLTLVQKKAEAAVRVEVIQLNQALAPEEITNLFVELERERIAEQFPGATDFEGRLLDADGRRIVAIQFARPGPRGPERVRQYSIAVGEELYRLVCSAPERWFAKYEPVFGHIAASFQPVSSS